MILDFYDWHSHQGGIAHSNPISWQQFSDFCFSEKHQLSKYIFRGQTKKSLQLESTFVRECRKFGKDVTIPNWKQHLENFRFAIRGRIKLGESESTSDQEIWSIGQHHGLATPLLDWTESPFVAAFFAFHEEQQPPPESERAIFAINVDFLSSTYDSSLCIALNQLSQKDFKTISEQHQTFFDTGSADHETSQKIQRIANNEHPASPRLVGICRQAIELSLTQAVKIVKPLSGENARLVNQRGLFTYFLRSITLEDIISEILAKSQESETLMQKSDPILAKFLIRDSEQEKVLKNLAQMNITYSSLFPDLLGSSKHCNMLMRELPES